MMHSQGIPVWFNGQAVLDGNLPYSAQAMQAVAQCQTAFLPNHTDPFHPTVAAPATDPFKTF